MLRYARYRTAEREILNSIFKMSSPGFVLSPVGDVDAEAVVPTGVNAMTKNCIFNAKENSSRDNMKLLICASCLPICT